MFICVKQYALHVGRGKVEGGEESEPIGNVVVH